MENRPHIIQYEHNGFFADWHTEKNRAEALEWIRMARRHIKGFRLLRLEPQAEWNHDAKPTTARPLHEGSEDARLIGMQY